MREATFPSSGCLICCTGVQPPPHACSSVCFSLLQFTVVLLQCTSYVCCWPPELLLKSRLARGSFSSWREHCKHITGRRASRRQADERAGRATGTAPAPSAANNSKANTYASLIHAEQWTAADCCCWQKAVHRNAQDMRRKNMHGKSTVQDCTTLSTACRKSRT